MATVNSLPKSGENVWLWLLKVLSGLGIVIVLLIHLIVNHLTAPEGLLTHADVVAYYMNPLIVIMEAVFLILVVSHSLIGLRSVILDLNPSRGVLRLVNVSLFIVGIISTVYGIWLLQAVVAQG
jgi:succinate dehydrogenase / fumarate reductase membrane anchor subunit